MRIAYLILAHGNIVQLAQLIDLLSYKTENYCFLHIDEKLYLPSIVRKLKKITLSRNWHIIKKRVAINWGGFNMVNATLNLILESINFERCKFDFLSLHSGMDLPIKNWQEINEYLDKYKGSQFMEFFKLPNYNNWQGNGGLDRINYYWFIDEVGAAEAYKLVNAQRTNKLLKVKPKGVNHLYGGSQWWTLERNIAIYLIDFLNQNSEFYHYFRFSYIPDELFFQTILLNSKYKHQVVNDNLRMIDWETGPQFPKIFDCNDLKRLEQSNKLFARKFNSDVDAHIISYYVQKMKLKT